MITTTKVRDAALLATGRDAECTETKVSEWPPAATETIRYLLAELKAMEKAAEKDSARAAASRSFSDQVLILAHEIFGREDAVRQTTPEGRARASVAEQLRGVASAIKLVLPNEPGFDWRLVR